MGSFMILFSSVLTFAFILCILCGLVHPKHDKRGDFIVSGCIGIFCTLMFGYGLFCSMPTYSKTETLHKPDSVFKNKRVVIAVLDYHVVHTTDKLFVDDFEDVLIKKIEHKNAWGWKSDEGTKYELVILEK